MFLHYILFLSFLVSIHFVFCVDIFDATVVSRCVIFYKFYILKVIKLKVDSSA